MNIVCLNKLFFMLRYKNSGRYFRYQSRFPRLFIQSCNRQPTVGIEIDRVWVNIEINVLIDNLIVDLLSVKFYKFTAIGTI